TEPSTTEPSTTEPSTTEPSASIPDETKPSIVISDKTMYVGDTLTKDDILGWATFENAEGYTVGFEVLGDPIQITVLGSKLVNTGKHSIRFYVEGTDSNGEKVLVEKTITLTILSEGERPTDPKDDLIPPAEDTVTPVDDPAPAPAEEPKPQATDQTIHKTETIEKSIESAKTTVEELPKTGEKQSTSLVALGSGLLGISLYLGLKGKKKLN
ncbi:MAG: LPXTG cell wall anchor domain-containing protein, partial [Enterococcus sp.]|uniref:LPXTG cell wall anchor domain-containing protein n=1 Tax=Enterococcus sp. TaxID=35783 RepID=UPI0026487D83